MSNSEYELADLLGIAGHNQRWVDGFISMVLINTFGLIFIDVIDPSVKDFIVDQ